jgi:hypothetical protein
MVVVNGSEMIFKEVAMHPPSFNIFGQVEIGFWVSSYFPIWGAKIKFK